MSAERAPGGGPQWQTRRSEPTDRVRIIELYRQNFGAAFADLMEATWDWKYGPHPAGGDGLSRSLVLVQRGRVSGFMGVIPARFRIRGAVRDGSWIGDFMVSPEARGRGGFILARALFKQEYLMMGRAGEGVERFWVKVCGGGDIVVTRLKRVRRKFGIRGAALRAAGWLNKEDDQIRIEPKKKDDDRHLRVVEDPALLRDDWLGAVLSAHENVPWRDRAYLVWRFQDCPFGTYRILVADGAEGPCGYLVLRVDDPRLASIVDVLARPEDQAVYSALLRAAMNLMRREGADGIETLALPQGCFAGELRRNGFGASLRRDSDFGIIGKTFDQALMADITSCKSSWHVTLADSDFGMQV